MAQSLNRLAHADRLREKIASGQVLTRLLKHFNGEIELSRTQVTTGCKLLNKVLPDLKATEITGEVGAKHSMDQQTIEQAANAVVERINAIRG